MFSDHNLAVYLQELTSSLQSTDVPVLSQIVSALLEAKRTHRRVYTAGNGGSASAASHMVNDLIKGCRVENRDGFRAECLSDSIPVVTCLANDLSYEEIYSLQLRTKADPGDLLVAFSGSGNSPNILRAAETAKEMGVTVIAFTGRDGGRLAPLSDLCIIAPAERMEQIEDLHLAYAHACVNALRLRLAGEWGMEILRYPQRKRPIQSALFDFDGTISLLRAGWQDVMIPYFVEVLQAAPQAEDDESLRAVVQEFVDLLTGKQTIYQCMRLDDEVVLRGGERRDPYIYKQEYLRRLTLHIQGRHAQLQSGESQPSEYLVPGCLQLIQGLQERGIQCYLASGTDQEDVLREARMLGLDQYFGGNIYGAQDHVLQCSKELVIQKIIEENQISPDQLVSFGDGYVEIELVASLGGFTFGVASDEEKKKGVNHWKRNRLTAAGADVIIPDFTGAGDILALIGGESNAVSRI